MDATTTPLRRLASIAMGLFALWQMFFLIAANFVDLVPRRVRDSSPLRLDPLQEIGTFTSFAPLQTAVDRLGDIIDSYGEFTGQDQTWPLFAPGFPPHSTFGAIEVKFADGTRETILSIYEPADYNHAPYRLPFFNVRRYNLEYQFIPAVMQHTDEALRDQASVIRDQTFMAYRYYQPALVPWLKWRAGEHVKAHPEHGEPVEIIYKARYVPTPLPSEPKVWNKPVRERPLARWRNPAQATPEGQLPLEVYDIATNRWVTLLKDGGER